MNVASVVEESTNTHNSLLSWVLVLLFSSIPLLAIMLILYIFGSGILQERTLLISQLLITSLAITTDAAVRGVLGLSQNKHRIVIVEGSKINRVYTVSYVILLIVSIIIYIGVLLLSFSFALKELQLFTFGFRLSRFMPFALIFTALSFIVGLLFQFVEIAHKKR